VSLSDKHINFLKEKFDNVESLTIDLTSTYNTMRNVLDIDSYRTSKEGVNVDLSLANTQSRLRMVTLYSYANTKGYIVCGTGNKVEDFGIGFFTKGGDGMVDVSPIGDLMKSEVYKLGEHLGIIDEIINTEPTDGLWEGSPTDEDQIGATYDELEWAMTFQGDKSKLSERQKEVIEIYDNFHSVNLHKMKSIPVCTIPEEIKTS
jgi:NAD+ synthase